MNSNSDWEIEIPWPVLVVGLLIIVFLLGFAFSPKDSSERPILLAPDVKAMEDYRRQASYFMSDMRKLDGEINSIMISDSTDLISTTQKAQAALNHAVRLAQEIDQTEAPSVFLSLRADMSDTALAYLEAARSAARWLSIPDQPNWDVAVSAQQNARDMYDELLGSKWLSQQ